MSHNVTGAVLLPLILGVGLSLGACTQSRLHLHDDFGQAVRQDLARVGLAQQRYVTGKVIPPRATTTSSISLGVGSEASGQ
jgi:hypothetical protein